MPPFNTGSALSGSTLANAQKLGLGGVSLSTAAPAPANPTDAPVFYKAPAPPTSPITQKPVTFAAATTPSTPAGAAPVTPTVTPTTSGGYSTPTNPNPTFNIDTTAPVSSTALNQNLASGDVTQAHNQYQQYVQQLATASGYSPDYLNAYQKVQGLQTAEAQLKGNLATGNVPGDTQGYAEGFTNRQTMGAQAQEAFANVALQAQALARQGDIAGANALVQAYQPTTVSPGSSLVSPADGKVQYGGMSSYQDIQNRQTYANYQQNYADAHIAPYDESISSSANLQNAQNAVAQAPSFASKQTVQVNLPGGGITFVNKNQLVPGANGQTLIISPAQAAVASASQKTIADLTGQKAQVQSAISTADANFPLLLQAASAAGVNNNSPLVNEIQKKILNPTSQSTALAQLNTLVPSLQTEYSRILARGGSVTDSERSTSQALINGNYSLAQLQAVYKTVKQESDNVISGLQGQIDAQTNTLNGIYASGTNLSSIGGGSTSGSSTAPASGSSLYSF